jgi:uncharacterized delta-60 repeat protein
MKPRPRQDRNRRTPTLEELESRLAPTVTPSGSASDFHVDINAAENVSNGRTVNFKFRVTVEGSGDLPIQMAASSLEKLTVTAVGNFANTLDFTGMASQDFPQFRERNVSAGGGNDTVLAAAFTQALESFDGGDGDDVIAIRNDGIPIWHEATNIQGGNGFDTLRLDGNGLTLLLTNPAISSKVRGIEAIDLSGPGSHTLTLNAPAVLAVSSPATTLLVKINPSDAVNKGPGWTVLGKEMIGGVEFTVYTQAGATLKVNDGRVFTPPARIAGGLDAAFGGDGMVTTPVSTTNDYGSSLTLQPDGKVIVGGTVGNGDFYDFALARYNADGSLDPTFGFEGKVTTSIRPSLDLGYSVALQADGKILVAGYSLDVNTSNFDLAVVRYHANGVLDSSWGGDGIVLAPISGNGLSGTSVVVQADGKVIAGSTTFGIGGSDFVLVRYLADGSLDTSFDGDGKVITSISNSNDLGNAVALQDDGKILLAGQSWNGSNYDFSVARYLANGALDTSFDGDGTLMTELGGAEECRAIAVQPDGKIVVAGATSNAGGYDMAVVRYLGNGALDTSFDGDGSVITTLGGNFDQSFGIAVQADGKLVVAGNTSIGSSTRMALVRYQANGALDSSWGGDGSVVIAGAASVAASVAIRADGKIVAAGYSENGSDYDFALLCYEPSGAPDTSFGGPGTVETEIGAGLDHATSLALQPDGKIVVAGSGSNATGSDFAMVRYHADGALDSSFDGDGKAVTDLGPFFEGAAAVALQADGKIVLAGAVDSGGNTVFGLVRYNANGTLDTSFDGDGKLLTPIGPPPRSPAWPFRPTAESSLPAIAVTEAAGTLP